MSRVSCKGEPPRREWPEPSAYHEFLRCVQRPFSPRGVFGYFIISHVGNVFYVPRRGRATSGPGFIPSLTFWSILPFGDRSPAPKTGGGFSFFSILATRGVDGALLPISIKWVLLESLPLALVPPFRQQDSMARTGRPISFFGAFSERVVISRRPRRLPIRTLSEILVGPVIDPEIILRNTNRSLARYMSKTRVALL